MFPDRHLDDRSLPRRPFAVAAVAEPKRTFCSPSIIPSVRDKIELQA